MVQEEVGQFGHGHHLLPQVSHWVVAHIQTGHLRQSGYQHGKVWKIRMQILVLITQILLFNWSELLFVGVFPLRQEAAAALSLNCHVFL